MAKDTWTDKYWDDQWTWEDFLDFFKQDEDYISVGEVQDKLDSLKKIPKDDRTKKDYYDALGILNKFKSQVPGLDVLGVEIENLWGEERAGLRDEMDELFPDRGKGTKFGQFVDAYEIKDKDQRDKRLSQLRSGQVQSPHKGQWTQEDIKAALARGAGKRKNEEAPYEGPFGKLGEYFSKNAAARDKLFAYIGEMGKELVKPIEPGKAAAGALVPTLSRGLDKGQKRYQAERAAEAKMMKDLSQAQKDANPLQFFTNKMKEARYMAWSAGVDPDSVEGTSWIGNWLQQQGMASGAADLSAAIKSMSEAMRNETNPEKQKDYQKQIDKMNEQLTAIVMQSSGGGYEEEVIDYDSLVQSN